MKPSKAAKILKECGLFYIKQMLACEANLFEDGYAKDVRFEKAFQKREEILHAIEDITDLARNVTTREAKPNIPKPLSICECKYIGDYDDNFTCSTCGKTVCP